MAPRRSAAGDRPHPPPRSPRRWPSPGSRPKPARCCCRVRRCQRGRPLQSDSMAESRRRRPHRRRERWRRWPSSPETAAANAAASGSSAAPCRSASGTSSSSRRSASCRAVSRPRPRRAPCCCVCRAEAAYATRRARRPPGAACPPRLPCRAMRRSNACTAAAWTGCCQHRCRGACWQQATNEPLRALRLSSKRRWHAREHDRVDRPSRRPRWAFRHPCLTTEASSALRAAEVRVPSAARAR
mmetsp:Transcript_37080/g.102342  ORF Transcript_37080/g.102342 Transcript_37080/m.102342 type:complete len:242 (-) Transcript_37080:6-731(-)